MEIELSGSPARNGTGTASIPETGVAQGRHMAVGTLRLLSVHALLLPLGLLTEVFLTRQLGPELYGVFAVAASIVLWVKSNTTAVFGRTTVKFVAEAADCQRVASALTRAQLAVSLGVAGLLLVGAPVLSSWLKSPELTPYLRLFALEVPVFSLARSHLSTLTGLRAFGRVAFLTAVYGLSRMMLVFLLVGLGLSLTGAILAAIGASLVQLILARVYIRPAILSRAAIPMRRFASYASPLLLHAIGWRLFTRLDLLVVKTLSETSAAAGYYSAARNLTRPVALFAASFTPLLLATLTQAIHQRQMEAARSMIRQAMRLVLCFLPFAGIVAGSAPEIVALVYGRAFLAASPLLALLILGALANTMISLSTGALTAASRPGWTFVLTGPLVPLALGAHLALVPRFGAVGAAAATTALAWLGAGAAMLVVHRQCGVYPAPETILRTALTTLVAYALSSIWHTSGAWLVVELVVLVVAILSCLYLLGELTGQDLAFARSLLRQERRTST